MTEAVWTITKDKREIPRALAVGVCQGRYFDTARNRINDSLALFNDSLAPLE